jgi:gamma-glutamylcyclotransferase (GGCT)/AIG2-like uncharacterized protein YtfP
MTLLFSYGTLQQQDVQRWVFGRLLKGESDELRGYEETRARVRDGTVYPNVTYTGRDESRVKGTVFEISEAELAAADRYEEPEEYQRVEVVIASGKQAWVYVHRPVE